jgi:L-lactate dehydrogenase
VPALAASSPDAILIVVSNPVDVMTYHALELSGFPSSRVFGTGTLIDSARFRTMLSEEMAIHPDDVRAYTLGEHGDTQFPLYSQAVAGGMPIVENERTDAIFKQASRAGFDVVLRKGHTNYAISLAVALIIEAVAWDTKRTMPLSVRIDDFCGVRDVCLSLPVVMGGRGILRVLHPDFNDEERASFRNCAGIVRQAIEDSKTG